MSSRRVLDASAIIAVLRRESGAAVVEAALETGVTSAVNWCEVAERAEVHGIDVSSLRRHLLDSGLEIVGFDAEQAEAAARLRAPTRSVGLGIADRACLALAQRLGVPAVTADRTWAEAGLDVEIVTIR